MNAKTPEGFRLVGYCTRCGGDCLDNGKVHLHRCPPKRPEADAVVAAKFACASVKQVFDRRCWAAIIRKEDCADLIKAIDQLQAALSDAYPGVPPQRMGPEEKRRHKIKTGGKLKPAKGLPLFAKRRSAARAIEVPA